MEKIIHGGDIYSHGPHVIDFSANINPLGLPLSVQNTLSGIGKLCESYPDPLCRKLTACISEHEGVLSNHIICGNGAADLIFRIVYALKPKRALVLAPTFAEYELALQNVSCETRVYELNESDGFIIKEDILSYIENIDLLFICNPNNPTGVVTDFDLLTKILHKAEQIGAMLIVDECFLEFLENHEDFTMKNHIKSGKNLIILKAFTKMYAMPGIRLGYCMVGNKDLVPLIISAGAPWSVSTVAQECGISALEETYYIEETKKVLEEQRLFLYNNLKQLGINVFESKANYFLFKSNHINFYEELLEKGILIRDCSNYNGLTKGFYRIAVKGESDNKRLIKSLESILRDNKEMGGQNEY